MCQCCPAVFVTTEPLHLHRDPRRGGSPPHSVLTEETEAQKVHTHSQQGMSRDRNPALTLTATSSSILTEVDAWDLLIEELALYFQRRIS